MTEKTRAFRFLATCLIGLFCAAAVQADVVVLRTGTESDPFEFGGDSMLAVSWTQPYTTLNTYINAYNFVNNNIDLGITINFSLRLGSPDALPEIAGDTFGLTNGASGDALSLFSAVPGGLTLGPGTYFLVASTTGSGDASWLTLSGISSSTPTNAFGTASLGNDWAYPAGDPPAWYDTGSGVLGFDVNGTPAAAEGVPEPATWAFVGAGLIGLAAIVRRRRA